MSKSPYKVGDRIILDERWRHDQAGVLTKIGRGSTVMVRMDGAAADERIYLDTIRKETPKDVAARKHQTAMLTWREERPETVVATVEYGRDYSTIHIERGAIVRLAADSGAMRTAARELVALADWFERKPKETP